MGTDNNIEKVFYKNMAKSKKIILQCCLKGWTRELDKVKSPKATVEETLKKLEKAGSDIVEETKRIDNFRLDIPVYISRCGEDAKQIIPTRKQMGKGSSPEQAEASALMELMERYAFFSFWDNPENFVIATWDEAEKFFGKELISIQEILLSVHDNLDEECARKILNTVSWQFYPATRLDNAETVWLPLDWFRYLGEFNGSSAGNTNEESILQGLSELIERHVSALAARDQPVLPTIDLESCRDAVLKDLIKKFHKNGIILILKDMSQGMPMPTVGALAWDPATFPGSSEIVFTAGTAASPEKAAIRAITEVAQLAGDFNSNACYEASGLPKYTSFKQIDWLLAGPTVPLDSLPDISRDDIYEELLLVVKDLLPIHVYAVETTNPAIDVSAHFCVAPGLEFRERDNNQTLGLFVGRKLVENYDAHKASQGLEIIAGCYPNAHFLHFFYALIKLKNGEKTEAAKLFEQASLRQPDADSKALTSFYAGYSYAQSENWAKAQIWLKEALRLSPHLREAINLLGVINFKQGNYQTAIKYFDRALKEDKGSAIDLANRGVCLKMSGKTEEAREDLQNALTMDPTLEFARKHLSEIV